jgi:hypothetical protein
MAPLPNSFLCFFTYVIAREKQRRLLGGGAIADGTTDAKNASVDGPLRSILFCPILVVFGPNLSCLPESRMPRPRRSRIHPKGIPKQVLVAPQPEKI